VKTIIKPICNFFKSLTLNNRFELYTPDPKKEPETELDYDPSVHKKIKRKKKEKRPTTKTSYLRGFLLWMIFIIVDFINNNYIYI
jgi:hypothetical protein